MKRRDFGAGARVCFAAVVRWAMRAAGVMGLENAPAPCRERKERGTRVEMDSAVSRTTRLARGNRPAPCKERKERGTRGRKISVRGLLAVIHDIRKSPPYLQIAGTGVGCNCVLVLGALFGHLGEELF